MDKKRLFLSMLLMTLLLIVSGIIWFTSFKTSSVLVATIIVYLFIFLFVGKQFHAITSIVAGVLLLGVMVVCGWLQHESELVLVGLFSGFSIVLIILWCLILLYDRAEKASEQLNQELQLLRKYADQEQMIYTPHEFEDRSRFIIQSCLHHTNCYCLVTMDGKDSEAVTYEALHHHLKVTLLELLITPRFDIVGENEKGQFVLLLQNCTKQQAKKRIQEYLRKVQEEASIKEDDLFIRIEEGGCD